MRFDRTFASAAIGVLLLIGSAASAHAKDNRAAQPADLDVGWRWAIEPVELREGWRSNGFTRLFSHGALILSETPEGGMLALLSQSVDLQQRGSAAPRFRLVLLDDKGAELRTTGSWSSANRVIRITSFRSLDKADSVERVGLAVLDLEGRREQSEAAMRDAADVGASVLPLPVIGEPLEFDLPTVDGGRVRSDDLKGKIVLIDCWATWCGPCMSKMPELKKARETYEGEGLVVVSVNFDDDPAKAKSAIEQGGLDWAHVSALYDAGIARFDGHLGPFLRGLDFAVCGKLDDAVVLLFRRLGRAEARQG